MADRIIAIYFGIGVMLPQLLHTYYASDKYGQKFVPALEFLVPKFSRSDPPSVSWLQRHEADSPHPLVPPWKLKSYQILPPPYNGGMTYKVAKLFGLHATNLVYCYVMSIVYGVIGGYVVLRFVHPLETVTRGTMIYFIAVFAPLLFFSLFFVGWSRTEIGIELIVVVNVIVLMVITPLTQGAVLTFATFGEGPIIAGLFHWLHTEGEPLIGPSGAYVVFSVGFAEMGALFLLLPALA